MARFPRTLKELCTPAAVYFVISIIGLLLVAFQNMGNTDMFYMGDFSRKVPSTMLLLFSQFIYILFWTYVLNLICKDGHSTLSWLIVLLPILMMFVLLALYMLI